MTRYVWDKERRAWVLPTNKRQRPTGPCIVPDIPDYRSPLGTGVISGRRQRREDLKRAGCREVDPSERIDPTPKSAEQLASEKAYLKARETQPGFDRRIAERLMRG
jgi:hypothetical protein